MNAVQLEGEEMTWTRTSQLGGLIILPEEMPAGTRLNVRMDFETRALKKWTYSFTEVSRFGWMPFVRFGDFIDDLRTIADGLGRTVAQLVVNWTIHQPGITAALCGAKRAYQIEETASAMDWELDEPSCRLIDEALQRRGPPVSQSAV